jgi:hypothetical protein
MSSGRPEPGGHPRQTPTVLVLEAAALGELAREQVASPASMIVTRRSICRTMTSMCLSWIDTPCWR